jgi:hypothetical protein
VVRRVRRSSLLEEVATQFQNLLRSMTYGDGGLQMESVVKHATEAIHGADHAAVTLKRVGRRPQTVYSTGDLPLEVDALQYKLDEGPCVSALTEYDMVWVNDLAHDDQFPDFSPGAVKFGVQSMLSTRLFLSPDDRAALNLYSTQRGAFRADQLPLAAIFASFASLVLLKELREDQIYHLERALQSNREIGVAIGILMVQNRCTHDEALDQLLTASQHLNRRLRDIAEEVNQTGRLPDHRRRTRQ